MVSSSLVWQALNMAPARKQRAISSFGYRNQKQLAVTSGRNQNTTVMMFYALLQMAQNFKCFTSS